MYDTLAAILSFALAGPAGGDVPIVFLPGTGASVLRAAEGGGRYWLDDRALNPDYLGRGRIGHPTAADLTAGQVLDVVTVRGLADLRAGLAEFSRATGAGSVGRFLDRVPIGLPVHDPFLRWARAEFGPTGWFEAPYDWRLRPADNLAAVDRVVDRAREAAKSEQVILLGHSLGGLVAREYAATRGKGKVRAVVAVGTPWLGTPQAARGVLLGYDFGAGLSLPARLPGTDCSVPRVTVAVDDRAFGPRRVGLPHRASLVRRADARALAETFPSAYLMLPTRAHDARVAELLGAPEAGRVSPVAEWSRGEFEEKVRAVNGPLADWAAGWRARYLSGEGDGADYFLLGQVCETDVREADWQVLRFSADPPRGVGPLDDGALRLRREVATRLATRSPVPVELSEYVPTDLGPQFGDGVVPLFSATAGAVDGVGGRPDNVKAVRLLGPRVRVVSGTLTGGRTHETALDDPAVRAALVRIWRAGGVAGRVRSLGAN